MAKGGGASEMMAGEGGNGICGLCLDCEVSEGSNKSQFGLSLEVDDNLGEVCRYDSATEGCADDCAHDICCVFMTGARIRAALPHNRQT